MKKRFLLIGLAAVLMAILGAARGHAITQCENCTCSMSCSALCTTSSGTSTCGAIGRCVGAAGCGGGGCLTAKQADFVLGLLDQAPRQATPAELQRTRAGARLTWRLAQFVEESGLGEVHAGGTAFLGAGQPAPDLAFVSRERLTASHARPATPDLVVRFAPSAQKASVAGWLGSGARAVLVLDPVASTATLHRGGAAAKVLSGDGLLEIPDLLPGWSLRVGDLFE
jgi:hypothetical protein